MGKQCLHFFSAVSHPFLFILAGNDDMHESLKEFEIRPDPTTDCGVSCPLESENIPLDFSWKNRVATFSWLFLIGSISYLQVIMTYMRAWMSLKFGQIRLLVSMATDRVIMKNRVLPLFLCCFLSDPFHTCRL